MLSDTRDQREHGTRLLVSEQRMDDHDLVGLKDACDELEGVSLRATTIPRSSHVGHDVAERLREELGSKLGVVCRRISCGEANYGPSTTVTSSTTITTSTTSSRPTTVATTRGTSIGVLADDGGHAILSREVAGLGRAVDEVRQAGVGGDEVVRRNVRRGAQLGTHELASET